MQITHMRRRPASTLEGLLARALTASRIQHWSTPKIDLIVLDADRPRTAVD